MDGWITIGTKLDTKGLEKDMKTAERELQKYQKDSEKLTTQKAQIEVDLSNFEKEKVAYDELRNKASQYRQEIQRLTQERKGLSVNGMISSEKVPEYEAQSEKIREAKQELAQINELIDKQANGIDKASSKYDEQKQKLAEINAQLSKNAKAQQELTGKIASVNEKLGRTQGIKNVSNEVGNISGKMTNILGKAARWALAIFSIRSIYSTLSSASATLAQYNEQYAANLEYIRFALAQMLAPVLEYIVRLMYTLLQYINAIAQAWFGVNLFANASADAFTKAKSSTGGIAKNAEKTRKELQQTNFDEMNILQDNKASTSGGTGGGGGAVAPSMDLSKLGDVELPGWLQWIAEHKDGILNFIKILAGLIAGIKIFQLVKGVGELFGGISAIKALGITGIIMGIIVAITSLINYLKDPTWKNFGGIIQGIGIAIIGLGVTIGALPVAIIGAAVLIHGTIMKYWDEIYAKAEGILNWFDDITYGAQDSVEKLFGWLPQKLGGFGKIVYNFIQYTVTGVITFFRSIFETAVEIFDKIYTGIKTVVDGIIKIFKGEFWDGLVEIGDGLWSILDGLAEAFFSRFVIIGKTISETFFKAKENLQEMWNGFVEMAVGAWEAVKKVFSTVATFFGNIFSKAWNKVKEVFSKRGEIFEGIKEGIEKAFKTIVNALITGINKVVAVPFRKINNMLDRIKKIEILGAKPFNFISTISIPEIPKLAKGTILNNPGKGVPVAGGRAIAGEAGREAYLPLSDKQLLEELGSTIGKYITINATVNNSMNGRLIGRIMQEIKAEQDFAYNT